MNKKLNAKEFGELLKILRTRKGITLVELGKMINYSNSYLSQIENGKKGIPSYNLIEKIANALNISQVKLLEEAGYDLSDFYEEQLHSEDEHLQDLEHRRTEYPDILEILNAEQKVYYDKKSLSETNRDKAIRMLNILFEDLEVDYPSDEKIEKEIKLSNNINDVIQNKKVKAIFKQKFKEKLKERESK